MELFREDGCLSDIVDMVMTLEDEFGIEVPDDAIENLRTVGDVVKFVDSHKG